MRLEHGHGQKMETLRVRLEGKLCTYLVYFLPPVHGIVPRFQTTAGPSSWVDWQSTVDFLATGAQGHFRILGRSYVQKQYV